MILMRLPCYSTEKLIQENQSFDLIHSYNVIQHIPPVDGMKIISTLFDLLKPGGIAKLHITYNNSTIKGRILRFLPSSMVSGYRKIKQYVLGSQKKVLETTNQNYKATKDPEIEMHNYDLNEITKSIQQLGVKYIHTEFTDHFGHLGVFIFFQKN